MLKTKTQFDPMKPGEQMLVVTSNLDKKTNANEQLSPMLCASGIVNTISKTNALGLDTGRYAACL